MSFFASVNGLQIVSGSLVLPLVGVWTADLHLASSQAVSGSVTVVIGNLTLTGFAYRPETYGGQTRVRLVGGYGGWRKLITAQGYGSDNGVQMSTVLQDAASSVGEKVNIVSDVSVGNGYARFAFASSVASDVLWQMVELGFMPAWYVDPEGMTQTGPWPSPTIATPFTVTDQKPDEGMIVVATEDYASWLPGCSFTNPLLNGSYTSAGVHYVWGAGGDFRFEVLTSTDPPGDPPPGDRVLGPIQQVIQKEIAPLRLHGKYRYTISNPSTTTIDASPKNTTIGLPELQNVPLMADSIATYTPPDGGDCIVEFLDGYIPICTWTAQKPTVASLLGGTNPVARLGDQVQVFLPPVVPFVSVTPPATGTFQIASPLTGLITQGSSTVNSD